MESNRRSSEVIKKQICPLNRHSVRGLGGVFSVLDFLTVQNTCEGSGLCGPPWPPVDSRGLLLPPVISRGLSLPLVASRGLSWSPVVSPGLPWFLVVSSGLSRAYFPLFNYSLLVARIALGPSNRDLSYNL